MNNFQKNKKAENTSEFKKQNKRIQCRECEGFEHIESECAKTLEKKRANLLRPLGVMKNMRAVKKKMIM